MHPSRDPTAPSDGSARPVCCCSSSSVSVDCLRREMTKDGNSWPDEAGCCCPGCFTWPGHKRSVERGKPAGSVAGNTSFFHSHPTLLRSRRTCRTVRAVPCSPVQYTGSAVGVGSRIQVCYVRRHSSWSVTDSRTHTRQSWSRFEVAPACVPIERCPLAPSAWHLVFPVGQHASRRASK